MWEFSPPFLRLCFCNTSSFVRTGEGRATSFLTQEVSSLVSLDPGCPWLLQDGLFAQYGDMWGWSSAHPTDFRPLFQAGCVLGKKPFQTAISSSALFPQREEMILCCEQGGFCKSQGVASLSSVGDTVTPGLFPGQGPGLGGCFPSPTKASSYQCLISLTLMKPIHEICPVRWHSGFVQPTLSGCPWGDAQPGTSDFGGADPSGFLWGESWVVWRMRIGCSSSGRRLKPISGCPTWEVTLSSMDGEALVPGSTTLVQLPLSTEKGPDFTFSAFFFPSCILSCPLGKAA